MSAIKIPSLPIQGPHPSNPTYEDKTVGLDMICPLSAPRIHEFIEFLQTKKINEVDMGSDIFIIVEGREDAKAVLNWLKQNVSLSEEQEKLIHKCEKALQRSLNLAKVEDRITDQQKEIMHDRCLPFIKNIAKKIAELRGDELVELNNKLVIEEGINKAYAVLSTASKFVSIQECNKYFNFLEKKDLKELVNTYQGKNRKLELAFLEKTGFIPSLKEQRKVLFDFIEEAAEYKEQNHLLQEHFVAGACFTPSDDTRSLNFLLTAYNLFPIVGSSGYGI